MASSPDLLHSIRQAKQVSNGKEEEEEAAVCDMLHCSPCSQQYTAGCECLGLIWPVSERVM